jgi:hypothetical protein
MKETTKRPRRTLVRRSGCGILTAAVVLGLVACGAEQEGSKSARAAASGGSVFRMQVRALNGPGLRVEWIDVGSGEWRIEQEGETIIYSSDSISTDSGADGIDVRTGSRAYLGPLVDRTVSQDALESYLAGTTDAAAVKVARADGGGTKLLFERGDIDVSATIEARMTRAQADARRVFMLSGHVRTIAREIPAGVRPTIPVRAYWLGPTVGGREAVTATEHYTPLTEEMLASPGWGPTDEAIVHSTFYELPAADGKSSALPDQAPPEGEIRVVSQPVEAVIAQRAIDAYNGRNGDLEYEPWPRQRVTLANGEVAVVIPDRGEGIGKTRASFAVITPTTLINVVAPVGIDEIVPLAAQLRPL